MTAFVGPSFGDGSASWYDALVSSALPTELTVQFLGETFGDPEDRGSLPILEIGVGTGRVARPLVKAGHRVTGTDVSPAMVASVGAAGVPGLTAVEHDITTSPVEGRHAGAYCVLNTLFMLGPVERQDRALAHLRESVDPGSLLVLEVFQPHEDFYDDDAIAMHPQTMDEQGVLISVAQHIKAERLVRTQSVALREGGVSVVPSSFHYRSVAEIDESAAAAGWSLTSRYASWTRRPFSDEAMNAISVYRAT